MIQSYGDKDFSWLHLSGLQPEAAPPPDALREDLAFLSDSGPWDAVIVTGDLVRFGRPAEYQRLTALLEYLFELLKELGSEPVLLAVPGNHDLTRAKSSEAKLLRFLAQDKRLQQEFWQTSKLRDVVERSFDNYASWWRSHPFPRPEIWNDGVLPGEFSCTLDVRGYRLGVVGLNTAYQQLWTGDFRGRLVLDSRQLKGALGGHDPDAWSEDHDACLLLTHHPTSWLHEVSAEQFRSKIAPAGRFVAHLCGSAAGRPSPFQTSPGRMAIFQAPPFRSHDLKNPDAAGYEIGSLRRRDGRRVLHRWPRAWHPREPRLIPDPAYGMDLDDDFHLISDPFADGPAIEAPPFLIERLVLDDFRCYDHLEVAFNRPSTLQGHWSCLAGINGSGKSSILQALTIVLLGPRRAAELGFERLNRMRRLVHDRRRDARIRVQIHDFETGRLELALEIGEMECRPVDGLKDFPAEMSKFWDRLDSRAVVGYGATRNLSPYRETRYAHLSAEVRRHMTLYDPLTQITSAEVLLEEQSPRSLLVRLLRQVIQRIFGEELDVKFKKGRVRFTEEEQQVEALDLPDGFRSSIAWLADLCSIALETAAGKHGPKRPEEIEAVVLLDEIDLHLHPSLQRTIVPRLRAALPRVQFIATTHSPLVLSNFDRAEIIALDRSVPGRVRELDRQILAFSVDQIYEWLMETPTGGAAIEITADAGESDREVAELLEMSPSVDADEAKVRVHQLLARVAEAEE